MATREERFLNFVKKSNILHNNKYNYSLVNYINSRSKIIIICPIHGNFDATPDGHLHLKIECKKCRNMELKKPIEQFIIDANRIHNKYDYSLVEYNNYKDNITIICPIHGKYQSTPKRHIHRKNGCPVCNESTGEKEISNVLEENNIKFKREYKFKDCKNKQELPFDFYLEELNTCIEFDGIQHFKPIDFFGGIKAFKQVQINDNIKTQYCLNNNIKLIRIKYNEKINIRKIK